MEIIVAVLAVIGVISIVYFIWYIVKVKTVIKNVNSGTDDQRNFKMMTFVLVNQMKMTPIELDDSFMYRFEDGSYISIAPSRVSDSAAIIANGAIAEEIAQRHFGLRFDDTNDGKIWTINIG